MLQEWDEKHLPDYLLEYIYLLLEEEGKNYPCFRGVYSKSDLTKKHIDVYAYCILRLLNAPYRFREPGQGIRVPLYQLWGYEYEALENISFNSNDIGMKVESYSEGLWRKILELPVYIRFRWKDRFKHTWILGGTGAGKTVLLQQLISYDIQTKASVIVIDSSGDLIDKLKHSKLIHSNRLVLIDPVDSIQNPLALNMFDVDLDLNDPVMYERQVNNVVEQLNFIFSSILESDLTDKQSIVLDFCCALMLRVEGATVTTFLELLRKQFWSDLSEYHDIIETMPPTAKEFFKTAYPSGSRVSNEFRTTKGEVHRRLLSLLSNTTISRLFTSPVNRLDIGKEMDKGKIILINTHRSLLGRNGCAFFGRFFLSQISQATIHRLNIPENKRRPTFVYIDECGDYLQTDDANVTDLLDKARKYRVGLTLAHQRIGQLTAGVYSAFKANSAIKIVGSPEDGNVNTLLRDLRLEQIPSNPGRFGAFIKGTRRGMFIRSRMGIIEEGPQRSEDELENVIRENRAKYCVGDYKPPEKPKIERREEKCDEPNDTPNDDIESFNTL